MILPLALASLLVSFVSAEQCARTYTVKPGDICDTISAANNASTYQLATANPSINPGCSNIVPDQVLCLGFVGQDCTSTYVAKAGDYCDLIASKFAINTTVLYHNNPQIDEECHNLYIGEVFCVAGTVSVGTPPAVPAKPSVPPPAAAHVDSSDSLDSADSADGLPEEPETAETPDYEDYEEDCDDEEED